MSEVPNRELVVYVLATLGGESQRVHTEDIAVKCHELFPQSFSWTKYTDLPDKDIVRVALTDARKPQWGSLVDGRAGEKRGHAAKTLRDPAPDGWRLTENGVRWVGENTSRFESIVGRADLKTHRQKIVKELARLRKQPLFLNYREKADAFAPPIGELADFVRCRVDAPEAVWLSRFEGLHRRAVAVDQRDIIDFLDKCRDLYLMQR